MFFEFQMGPGGAGSVQFKVDPTPHSEAPQQEPEYLLGPEGELIINRKDLLISSEPGSDPLSADELSKVYALTGVGWVQYATVHGQ